MHPFLALKKNDTEALKNIITKTYHRFLNKVAKSRNKTFDEIRAVAKGRVWTGEDAYNKGLVDGLGNIDFAIKLMKNRIDNKNVGLKFYPEREDSFTAFKRMFSNMSDMQYTNI
jgi:protease-4